MPAFDTLEYNGTERTFANWGFARNSCVTRRGNMKVDTFTATIAGADITANPTFPYWAAVIVRTNRTSSTGNDNSFSAGTIKFQGKRIRKPMVYRGNYEGVTYEFQGPWYDLDVSPYLQTFKGATTNFNPGEIVLYTAAYPLITPGGLRFISAGDQIQCILQFILDSYAALSLAAPFQYVGRDLHTGAIDLNVSGIGSGTVDENTDATGAPYNYSVNAGTTIDVSLFKLFLKSEIMRPQSGAQFIQKILEWSPRTNVAFDYTTTPPTIYFTNIDGSGAGSGDTNLPLFDGTNHKSIDLQKLEDLVPASVVIGYRITNTVGGSTVIDYVIDKYGPHGSNSGSDPNAGPGVVVQILDLQGYSVSFAQGQLDCETLAAIGGSHAARRAWWASKRGGELAKLEDSRVRFQDETGSATSIPNAKIYYTANGLDSTGASVTAGQEFTSADYSFFVNRLVRGTQHAWMTVGATAVKSVRAKIVAPMQFAEFEALSASGTPDTDTAGGPPVRRHNANDQQHCNVELTNGVTDSYSTIASSTAGESYIIGAGGIAQYLFNMLSTPQYEGDYIKVEANFGTGISLLKRVNLTGGRSEWTTMKAQIQDIVEEWGDKQTSVRIGVARHLNADQLSALLNMSRFRRAWFNPLLKADNTVASSGEIQMPVTAGQANTVEGLENQQQLAIKIYSSPPSGSTPGTISGQINLDPKKIKDILAATTPTPTTGFSAGDLKSQEPREVGVCLPDGTAAFMILAATGAYTKP
jgi:hypothetical protein